MSSVSFFFHKRNITNGSGERGRYAPLPQENECIQCQGGSFTEIETAATTCSQCQVGRVSTNTEGENSGPEGCKACDPGKYQMAVGQTACIDCPENEYAAEEASFLCRDCETDFGAGVGSLPGSSTCGICKPFFFMNMKTSTCESCIDSPKYEGFDCSSGGTDSFTTPINPGFWRGLPDSLSIRECRSSTGEWSWACLGGTNSGDGSDDVGGHGYCLEGYRGPLCAVCETGHYRDTDSQTCETCPPGGLELPDSTFTSPPFLVLLFFARLPSGARLDVNQI